MSRLLLFIALILFASTSPAQMTLQQKLQSESDIDTQFTILLNQSRSQDADFKIIRRSNLDIIRKNISDSLSSYKREIAKLQNLSSNSTGTIKSLQDSIASLESQLHDERKKTDSIGFLGVDFNKGTYHSMVWAIIAILGIILFIVLASFRKARIDAVEHKATAEEVQNELQAVKKKAMEKEQQLKRQLLDEQLKRNS
ncbi:MAG TPA: hypothetical protein PKA53_05600 [Sphingobacterium sp.]|nr:hypothetical protein [Sphingobacterium sp.]